jgi:HAD superfamily hydrolase (TIGR01509 family)
VTEPIRAVVFDFDGLIVDSESPEYLAWQAVHAHYGWPFPLESWQRNIGRNDDPFDALGRFREPDSPLAPEEARALWREHRDRLLEGFLTPMPGVVALIDNIRARGLRTAVASSSQLTRVRGLLLQLGLGERFDAVACGDEVPKAKPAPDVYRLAARRIGVVERACVALEDSPAGLRAAKAAGMWCIAVPSPLTRGMDFSAADLVVASLRDVTLDTVMTLPAGGDGISGGRT